MLAGQRCLPSIGTTTSAPAPVRECSAGEPGDLIRVQELRNSAARCVVRGLDMERCIQRMCQPPRRHVLSPQVQHLRKA